MKVAKMVNGKWMMGKEGIGAKVHEYPGAHEFAD
jgi:hypothetical protein